MKLQAQQQEQPQQEIASQSNLSTSIQSSISMSILLRFKSMDNFVKHLIGSLKFDNTFEANVEFAGDVYVVGNGPIMEEDHERLRAAGSETVFRCNGMRNLRWEEPVGVVYARKLTASGHYWGVTDDQCPRIASAKEVILIGVKGEVTEDGEKFKKKLPNVEVNGVYLSKDDKSDEPYSIDLDGTILHCPPKEHGACSKKAYGWSTGFMATVITRQRFPNAKIHLMGMNWNEGGKEVQAHPWNVEKRIIASLSWATVHKTKSKAYHDPNEKCQISSALLELEAR